MIPGTSLYPAGDFSSMAENSATILVEVAYARPDEQLIIALAVPPGTTLVQAIVQSRIQERFPEIDPATAKAGIFGKLSAPATILRAGDRVEIYRPLGLDAKARRKQRAATRRPSGASGPIQGDIAKD